MTDVPWNDDFDRILRSYCRLDSPGAPIAGDATFTALGVDSLGLLGLIGEAESVFDVTLPADLLTNEVLFMPATFWQAVQQVRADA